MGLNTLFIPKAQLDEKSRLKRIYDQHAKSDGCNSVSILYCPVCGTIDWHSSCIADAPEKVGLTVLNWAEEAMSQLSEGCSTCAYMRIRMPEVHRWVIGVLYTHSLDPNTLPPIEKIQ